MKPSKKVRIQTGSPNRIAWCLTGVLLLAAGCRTADFTGYSYDPPGVTDTRDREMDPHHRRTIGFLADSVWFSNEFDGSRMSDVYRVGADSFRVTIHPENRPINNSPWYAFRVWSSRPKRIHVELRYPGHRHRYVPNVNGLRLDLADSLQTGGASVTVEDSVAWLRIPASPDPTLVSAQPVHGTADYFEWLSGLDGNPHVTWGALGTSKQGREMQWLRISDGPEPERGQEFQPDGGQAGDGGVGSQAGEKGVVLVIGRQHPPEIPGYLVMRHFLERIAMERDSLSDAFRARFDVLAVPMMNPDGADQGHWRHNAGGIDLNRDWDRFVQPETRAARDWLLELNEQGRRVWYGVDFHSTNENILYPIERPVKTFPEDFTYRWVEDIRAADPGVALNVEPFDTSSPIAKNWIWREFGADAVTFEVDDGESPANLRRFAWTSAETLMQALNEEYDHHMERTK